MMVAMKRCPGCRLWTEASHWTGGYECMNVREHDHGLGIVFG